MAESSSESEFINSSSTEIWARPKSRLIMSSRPSRVVIFWISLVSVIILYWTWSLSSSPSTLSTPVVEVDASSHQECINDGYLLSTKIRKCKTRNLLQSVKPFQFKPKQISLTFFGILGQMGISWVTYDGDQVGSIHTHYADPSL